MVNPLPTKVIDKISGLFPRKYINIPFSSNQKITRAKTDEKLYNRDNLTTQFVKNKGGPHAKSKFTEILSRSRMDERKDL